MAILTIGLEHEQFIVKNGELKSAFIEGLPYDGGLILLENRGKPYADVFDAVYSLKADKARNGLKLLEKGISTTNENWIKKDKAFYKLYDSAIRKKATVSKSRNYNNLYNKPVSAKNKTFAPAGLHISFKKERVVVNKDGIALTIPEMFDFSKLFRALDESFKLVITESGRTEGFYEVKSDGRVEYRSLPQSILYEPTFPFQLMTAIKSAM